MRRSKILVALALLVPFVAQAASFAVTDTGDASDADTGDNVCATAGAVCTLRAALEQANALGAGPHTITLPDGTFTIATTLPSVTSDVAVIGASAATSIVQSSAPGHPRIFLVPSGGRLALTGVTLTGAQVAGGSAILATGGEVDLSSCAITSNSGGAVKASVAAAVEPPPTITATGTTFSSNTGGSALDVIDYSTMLDGCTFSGNQQTTSGLGAGIAIEAGSGVARSHTIVSSTFSGNTAGGGAGISIDNVSGTPIQIDGCTFTNNVASGLSGYGGAAILSFTSGMEIIDTTFTDNHATAANDNGGAILAPQRALSCRGCTFSGNTATGTGGAICATGIAAVNSTFTGNSAGSNGGAIYVDNPALAKALQLANVTISGNTANGGGGISGGSPSVVVKNTIIAANTAAVGPDCVGAVTSQGHNLIGKGTGCGFTSTTGDQVGTAAAPIAPGLGPLASNGGPTKTMALVPGSPAIDAGDPAGCTDFATPAPMPLATDQRDEARPTDGDGVGGAACDIGAFERAGALGSTTTSTAVVATTTSTTSTTLEVSLCDGGVAIEPAALVVRRVAPPAGDEALRFRGSLGFDAGTPAFFQPRDTGVQLLVEDLGGGGAAIFELSHRTNPIPAGAGCVRRDGWKGTRYANASGRLDPPACTAGSAHGLKSVRFKDRRAKGHGIAFVVTTRRSNLGQPVGPFRGTIVLGASAVAGSAGDCGVLAFDAGDCTRKGTTIACR